MLDSLSFWLNNTLLWGNTPYEWLSPLFYITTTEKRVFLGYLLLNGLLALVILRQQKQRIYDSFIKLFSKKLWLHPSFQFDIKLVFLNQWLWLLLVAPLLTSQVAIALLSYRFLLEQLGPSDFIPNTMVGISVFYSISIFLIDDFTRFYLHRLYHRYPLLWRFHAVHHSATLLTPFTLYRMHIVEMLINSCRSLLVFGLCGGIFIYFVDGKITPVEILGTSIFSFLFNIAGANLRHSHIWLGWGRFEKWILSPAQHQIHHSAHPQHFNKNYGVMIAIWDRLFNSWVPSKDQKVTKFGLNETANDQTIRHHWLGINK
jgi:sterol desaturase/sphingolipid hydroxylase (fatty acid hydroxylase superfamily)